MAQNLKFKKLIDRNISLPFILFFKYLALFLGLFLKRNHDLKLQNSICFIKLLGGGSLLIASPMIYSIKRNNPHLKIKLITTKSVKGFADILNVFDEVYILNDRNVLSLITSSLNILIRVFRIDTIVDLEVYSKLTSLFSLLTCARNRLSFYTETTFWKEGLSTHLIFLNRSSGIYHFYDQIAQLYKIDVDPTISRQAFKHKWLPQNSTEHHIAIAHGCSGLSPERMLNPNQWEIILKAKINSLKANHINSIKFIFFGIQSEHELACEIESKIKQIDPRIITENLCGQTTLNESIHRLSLVNELISIDSSIMHFARLMGITLTTYWGPTDPKTLLRPDPSIIETHFYKQISCSPCVHVSDIAPCRGHNICIKAHFENIPPHPWLIEA